MLIVVEFVNVPQGVGLGVGVGVADGVRPGVGLGVGVGVATLQAFGARISTLPGAPFLK
jgi:hypothetical protein